MICNILNSCDLSAIIYLPYPNTSYIFLHKYVNKINWVKIFRNNDNYKDIIPFIRKNFKTEYFKIEYLFSMKENSHLKFAKILLQKSADLRYYDLSWCSEIGNYKIFKLLLENGANIHIGDDNPLVQASRNGHYKVVNLLLEKGANIHARDDLALTSASENGHVKVVKILLEKGANIHAHYDFALKKTCFNGNLKIVRILLEKGANVNAGNSCAIKYAFENGHLEIVKILIQKGSNINDNILRWASNNKQLNLL